MNNTLIRGLTYIDTVSLVVGTIIGTGIFLKSATMAQQVGSPGMVLLVLFIVFFSCLNCMQVKLGGRVHSFLTSLKVFMVLALVIGIVFFSDSFSFTNLSAPDGTAAVTVSRFGLAMLSALWAFDGWNNMPMAAGEVQNPQRNVPLALISGVLLVVAIYLLLNLAYFLALPYAEVITA